MNSVDLIFAIVLLLATLRGYSKGLLGTLAGYVAPVLALWIAYNWSEPVHSRLVAMMPDAAILLDFLAPVLVFLGVVIAIRILAAILARLLGIGRSVPARVIAAAISIFVSSLVLGSFVVLIAEMKPKRDLDLNDTGEQRAEPVENVILNIDRELSQSLLAPPMAQMARAVIDEAIARKDDLPLLSREEMEDAAQKAADAALRLTLPPRVREEKRDNAPPLPDPEDSIPAEADRQPEKPAGEQAKTPPPSGARRP